MLRGEADNVNWYCVSFVMMMFNRLPPNGLGFSGGAHVDREGFRADSGFQNGRDLVGAERRPLQPPMHHTARRYSRNSHHRGSSMGVPEQALVRRQSLELARAMFLFC